jgi:predicted solute-binding protein
MTEEEILQYFKVLRYRVGPEEEKAIALFRELLNSLPA